MICTVATFVCTNIVFSALDRFFVRPPLLEESCFVLTFWTVLAEVKNEVNFIMAATMLELNQTVSITFLATFSVLL